MNWIALTITALLASTLYGFVIRRSSRNGIHLRVLNLAMFSATGVCASIILITSRETLLITGMPLFVTILAAVFFSYLGTYTSIKSVSLAPNGGYATAISDGNGILVTIGSVLFFNDPLSLQKVAGMLIIIVFSLFILINRKPHEHNRNSLWVLYAVVSFFGYGSLTLASRYTYNSGVSPTLFLVYVLAIVCTLIFIELKIRKIPLKTPTAHLTTIAVGCGACIILNLAIFKAYNAAPNAGYVSAIVSTSTAFLCILGFFFFKDHLSVSKLIGVIGMLIGLTFMFI